MKQFPIKNEHFHPEYGHIYNESEIPVFEWGKKIYMIYKDALRAIIPIFVAKVTDDRKDIQLRGWDTWMGCRIAGEEGVKLISLEGYYDRKFFLTPEDYDKFCKNGSGRYNPRMERLSSIIAPHCLGFKTGSCCFYYEPQLWYFDKYSQRPKLTGTAISALWVDEDGYHVQLRMHNSEGDIKYYISEKQCMDENKKSVIDFEEEQEEDSDKEWVIDLPKTVIVKAASKEEAINLVQATFSEIINK